MGSYEELLSLLVGLVSELRTTVGNRSNVLQCQPMLVPSSESEDSWILRVRLPVLRPRELLLPSPFLGLKYVRTAVILRQVLG